MQGGAIVIPRGGSLDINYILHRTTGDLIVPLTADVTTANVQDNQMYVSLTSSSICFLFTLDIYMVADPGYDDKKLYEYSKKTLGIDLVCPVKRYKNTPKERLELVCFYQSILGQCNLQPEKNICRAIDRTY